MWFDKVIAKITRT